MRDLVPYLIIGAAAALFIGAMLIINYRIPRGKRRAFWHQPYVPSPRDPDF